MHQPIPFGVVPNQGLLFASHRPVTPRVPRGPDGSRRLCKALTRGLPRVARRLTACLRFLWSPTSRERGWIPRSRRLFRSGPAGASAVRRSPGAQSLRAWETRGTRRPPTWVKNRLCVLFPTTVGRTAVQIGTAVRIRLCKALRAGVWKRETSAGGCCWMLPRPVPRVLPTSAAIPLILWYDPVASFWGG